MGGNVIAKSALKKIVQICHRKKIEQVHEGEGGVSKRIKKRSCALVIDETAKMFHLQNFRKSRPKIWRGPGSWN